MAAGKFVLDHAFLRKGRDPLWQPSLSRDRNSPTSIEAALPSLEHVLV